MPKTPAKNPQTLPVIAERNTELKISPELLGVRVTAADAEKIVAAVKNLGEASAPLVHTSRVKKSRKIEANLRVVEQATDAVRQTLAAAGLKPGRVEAIILGLDQAIQSNIPRR